MTTPQPQRLDRPVGGHLAYHRTPGRQPGIVFLGGFASDMTGSKALALETFAERRGQAFLRFDYTGHGQSSGRFEDGTIGEWAGDARLAIETLTEGPQVLVGSSMGGWMMLLSALHLKERVAGLVGIAAAPDFTEDLIWAQMDGPARERLKNEGRIEEPSDYGDPLPITRDLIEEGRNHLLMRAPIGLHQPTRLLHGMVDVDVPYRLSLDLADRLESDDVEVTLVKNGDHRLSEPADIARLEATLERLLDQLEGD